MFQRRVPEWVRHPPTPGVRGFAALTGIEATGRGMLIAVFPLAMYRVFQDAAVVSEIYFFVGIVSLLTGLLVPWIIRFLPRRWTYTAGCLLYVSGAALGALAGEGFAIAASLLLSSIATVTVFVCLNAYVLDYIGRRELGRSETLRMFYSAFAWTAGPVVGVWLFQWWPPAPFIVSGVAACILLGVFWWMRLGDGKLITRARAPAPNPLAYLPRFMAQPRLVAGWLFAVLRSCGWWVYVVYVPIFAVQNGLGESVGGITLSLTNAVLFTTPLMLKWVQRRSVKTAVRLGFLCSGVTFVVATFVAGLPWLTIASLMTGSVALILLDICGGLPFLMAVKPSERTEMSAVYSTFRDASGIMTPGVAWLVLLVAPVSGVFVAAGIGLLTAWSISSRLHDRLGTRRGKLQPA